MLRQTIFSNIGDTGGMFRRHLEKLNRATKKTISIEG
jgi:hypothetical protein